MQGRLLLIFCLPVLALSLLKTPHSLRRSGYVAPPPPPDLALECSLKELLLNASLARLPWFGEPARIHDALQCCSARPLPRPVTAAAAPAPAALQLFVHAQAGLDGNAGTAALPLQTVHAAQRAARRLRLSSNLTQPVTVHLQGTFYLPEALVLDSAADASTSWQAWPGAAPAVLSGGIPLENLAWGPSALYSPPVLSALLPASAPASGQLFSLFDLSTGAAAGRRLPCAREPNGDAEVDMQPVGWALCRGQSGSLAPPPGAFKHIEVDTPVRNNTNFPAWGRDHDPRNPGVGYVWYAEGSGGAAAWMSGNRTFWANKTLPGGLLWNASGGLDPHSGLPASPFSAQNWPATVQPTARRRAHVFHGALWGNWVFDIDSVDAASQAIQFARGGFQEGRGESEIYRQPFFVEGEALALDSAGEWWIDPATQLLHLYPNASDLTPPALLVLPVLETLLRVGALASDVRLSGLAFQHTVDGLMQPYSVPEAGDWSLRLAGAVQVEGAQGTVVQGCAFQRLGGNGLLVTGAARDTLVQDSEFLLSGSSAIAVVGSAPFANSTPATAPAAYPSGVLISRVLVEGVGVLGKQSSALFVSVACGVVLEDSVLYSGPRAGVNWNDRFCGGHEIRSSVIFDWVRETQDHGPINTWGRSMYQDPQNASAAASPQWHRIVGSAIFNGPSPNRDLGNLFPSIDNDDGSGMMWSQGNVLLYGGTKNYLGTDKVWDSNLIVFPGRWSGDSCLTCWSGGGHVFTNNTCYTPDSDSPTYFDSSPDGSSCMANYSDPQQAALLPFFARNTYGTHSGQLTEGCSGELSLAGLQALGQELGTVVTKGYEPASILAQARALLGLP